MSRREIKNTLKGFVNPTTRTGKIVHAPGSDTSAWPKCDRHMYGIMYTDETVNCPACLEVRCATCNGLCIWADDAWVCTKCGDEWYSDHGPEYRAPGDKSELTAPPDDPSKCPRCGGECMWDDEAWGCTKCGDEWYSDPPEDAS